MKLACLFFIHLSAATPSSKFLGDYAQLDDDDEPSFVEAPHVESHHRRGHKAEHKSRIAASAHSPRTKITANAALIAAAELTSAPAHDSVLPAINPTILKDPKDAAMVQNLTTLLLRTKENQQKGKKVEPDAFDGVITSVRGQMTTQLQDHCAVVGTDLSTAAAAMTECATQYSFANANVGSGYNGGLTAFDTSVTDHDAAVTTETTECAVKVTKCAQRDNDGSTLYNTVRGGAQCAVPATPPAGTVYDEGFVFGGVKTWTATINSMHAAWATSKEQCNAAITVCADAETTTAQKETARVEACSTLEAAAVAGTDAYDDCYNAAKGVFDGKMEFEEGLNTQKELVNQVETLICYIKVAMKTINDPDVPARTDGSVACGDAGPSEYQCTCTSNDGQEYQQIYNLNVIIPTEPTKDLGWDDKSCAETPEPATSLTVDVHTWYSTYGSGVIDNFEGKGCVGNDQDVAGAVYSVDIPVAGQYTVNVEWGISGTWDNTYVQWGTEGTADNNIISVNSNGMIATPPSVSTPTTLSAGTQQLYIGSNSDGNYYTVPWCAITVDPA